MASALIPAICLYAQVIRDAQDFASRLRVTLIVEWQDEGERLTFFVARGKASRGSGAQAIAYLLMLADEANLPVVIDVLESEPALIRYYWRFGFRLGDGSGVAEIVALADLLAARTRFLQKAGHTAADFGVTFMGRDRHAGGLLEP